VSDAPADTTILEFLTARREAIVADAEEALGRAHSRHYESAGAERVHARLESLYGVLLEALERRNLGPMLGYAHQVAKERFDAGYDLSEVQTAFNALEEAIWRHVFADLDPTRFAEALGLVSTILGAAKDALARTYVSRATNTHTPSLDLNALFAGTGGA